MIFNIIFESLKENNEMGLPGTSQAWRAKERTPVTVSNRGSMPHLFPKGNVRALS